MPGPLDFIRQLQMGVGNDPLALRGDIAPDPMVLQHMMGRPQAPAMLPENVPAPPGMFGMNGDRTDALAMGVQNYLQSLGQINPHNRRGDQNAEAFLRGLAGSLSGMRVAEMGKRQETGRRNAKTNEDAKQDYRERSRTWGQQGFALRRDAAERRAQAERDAAQQKFQAEQKQLDREASMREAQLRASRAGGGGLSGMGDLYGQINPEAIADGIVNGTVSPLAIQQIGRPAGAAVVSILATKYPDYNLQTAGYDATGANALFGSLNRGLQQRLRQAVFNVGHQADLVRGSAADVTRTVPGWSQFSTVNRLLAGMATNGLFGKAASSNMTRLRSQVKAIQFEVSNILQGGGVPTDQANREARNMISETWSVPNIQAALMTIDQEVANRLRSFHEAGVASPSNPAWRPMGGTFRVGEADISVAPRYGGPQGGTSGGDDWFKKNGIVTAPVRGGGRNGTR